MSPSRGTDRYRSLKVPEHDLFHLSGRSLLRGEPGGGEPGEPVKQAPDHVLCGLRAMLRLLDWESLVNDKIILISEV